MNWDGEKGVIFNSKYQGITFFEKPDLNKILEETKTSDYSDYKWFIFNQDRKDVFYSGSVKRFKPKEILVLEEYIKNYIPPKGSIGNPKDDEIKSYLRVQMIGIFGVLTNLYSINDSKIINKEIQETKQRIYDILDLDFKESKVSDYVLPEVSDTIKQMFGVLGRRYELKHDYYNNMSIKHIKNHKIEP
jgi:hypothetical protein